MRRTRPFALLCLLIALAAPPSTLAAGAGPTVTGGGWFLFANSIPMQFSFSAVAHADGSASGSFHHAYFDGTFTYQFWGTVTCVTFDTAAGRAWIGGVLTMVRSDDPDMGLGPGDDAWFRVLDSADGDRSTTMGFVGIIPSSEEYCRLQIWPDGNARTHPVTSGQLQIRAD